MKIEIVSPSRKVFSDEATGISLPSSMGYIEILEDHCPLVAELGIGTVKLLSGKYSGKDFFLSGGYVEVKNNSVTVLAETIEEKKDIDTVRAEEARKRAEERLASYKDEIDIARATAALERALQRINISSH